ncbi:MAG: guanylate kinase [Gammaproteobacteria bacterium]|jgi:guanylate kinase
MAGTLYIISAASGTGKTSLVNTLVKSFKNLEISVSYTTRPKRSSEKEGKDYHFVTQKQFDKMVANGEFLEYATVFGKHYGTSKTEVQKKLDQGVDVILEIDWQGARQARKSIANVISIFILPPSKEELKRRIIGRNQDEIVVINQRLKAASHEISHYNEYNYLVVNDKFDDALTALKSIVLARRCREDTREQELKSLLEELMRCQV